MIDGVVTVFRLRGIPARIHLSWLVIVGLITWSLSVGYFPQLLPGLPLATHWAQGFLAALLLFVPVFLHELSHAMIAPYYGIERQTSRFRMACHRFTRLTNAFSKESRPSLWPVSD